MRTKTLLLSGVVAALSSVSLMAQVYSLNAVGYINVTVPPNFSIFANQLNAGNNNVSPLLDAQLGDGFHNGITIFKYNSSTASYTVLTADSTSTPPWSQSIATSTTLNPGEAAWIYNPYSTNVTITFVGTVLQGNLTNSLAQNFNMVSSIVPQSGALDTAMSLVPNNGDTVFLYSSGTASYLIYTADSTVSTGWDYPAGQPTSPTPSVGQGFWYYTPNALGVSWTRTFSVN
jgi:hypothetical protein